MGNSFSVEETKKAFETFLQSERGGNASTLSNSDGGQGRSVMNLDDTLNHLLELQLTEEQVAEALPLYVVREMRHCKTSYFASLLYACIAEVHAMGLRRAKVNGSLPTETGISGKTLNRTDLTGKEILRFSNALLILRRCLPFALEDGFIEEESFINSYPLEGTSSTGTGGEAVREERRNREKTVATFTFQQLFFIEGRKCDDRNMEDRFPPLNLPSTSLNGAPPRHSKACSLSKALIWGLVESCFIRGLTMPYSWQGSPCEGGKTISSPSVFHDEVDVDLLWYEGVGSYSPLNCRKYSTMADKSVRLMRIEVLKTLLSSLSSQLYHRSNSSSEGAMYGSSDSQVLLTSSNTLLPPSEGPAGTREARKTSSPLKSAQPVYFRDTLFLEPLIDTLSVPLMPTLAASLLNSIVQYIPYGSMPYMSYLGPEGEREVLHAARLLLAVLSYVGSPSSVKYRDPQGRSMEKKSPSRDEKNTSQKDVDIGDKSDAGANWGEEEHNASSQVFQAFSADQEGEQPKESPKIVGPVISSASRIAAHQSMKLPAEADAGEFLDSTAGTRLNRENVSPGFSGSPPTNSGRIGYVHSVRKLFCELTMAESSFIIENFQKLIGLRTYASQTYLPDSQKTLDSQDEFVLLLWRLIDLSPMVYQQFGLHPKALLYILPLMEYGLDVRKNVLKYFHHFQLVCFIFLKLSEQRHFCVQCNKILMETVPFHFPRVKPGSITYSEFIVLGICTFLDMKYATLTPTLSSCSVILANMGPYITLLNPVTATWLTNTFTLISSRCLRLQEQTPICEAYETMMLNLCEMMASILQYNGGTSGHCLLAALLQHRVFIRALVEIYVSPKRRSISAPNAFPFLISTLDAAIVAAFPLIIAASSTVPTSFACLSLTDGQTVESIIASVENGSFKASSPLVSSAPPFINFPNLPNANNDIGSNPNARLPVADSTRSSPPGSSILPIDSQVKQTELVLAQLKNLSLVGVLPPTHPLIVRRFQTSAAIEQWALLTFWTCMYTSLPAGSLGDRYSAKFLLFR